ncbi:MAG: PAS domain S-box protein [Desulfobacteraceae bacterium]|nr:PAS domain S-box protein [Desulfobacteraceae bacterium]
MRQNTDMGTKCSQNVISLITERRWTSAGRELIKQYQSMRDEESEYSAQSFIIATKADRIYLIFFGIFCFLVFLLSLQIIRSNHKISILKRMKVEKALQNSERYLRSIYEAAENIAFVVTDLGGKDTKILDISPGAEKIFHYTRDEVIGKKVAIFHPPEIVEDFPKMQAELFKNKKGYSGETVLVRKSGDQFPALFTIHPKFDKNGKINGTIGVSFDISERKVEEEKYKKTIESSIDGFWIVDRKGNFLEVNQAYSSMIGYSRNELLKMSIMSIEAKEHPKETKERIKKIIKNGSDQFESKHRHKKGHIIDVEVSTTFTQDNGGMFYVFLRNITKRNQMEERLRQAQKMESIGNLAGGIAHDFNNLLYPIIGFAEILKEDLPPDSPEYESVQEIFNAGKRGGELVNQILAFSRQSDHKLQPVLIQKILKEVLKLTRSSIPSDIGIHQDVQQDCGSVMADATQLHQITMNLITNAYHAVENTSGIISVQLKEIIIDEGELKDSSLKSGQYAMISVSDNGLGIPRNTINNIFEPYFTTKEKGKGTGLGLAVVYGIVKEHKGDIKVSSEEGKGTTFNVYIPLIKKPTKHIENDLVPILPTGTESLMLVDDEESVVRLEKQMLERLGYNVSTFSNSLEALETFKSNPNGYDLVISDMTMPGITGDKLAKEILSIKSDMPVIICTGFSERINKVQAEVIGMKGFLKKPVVKSEMAQMVRKVLDEAKVFKGN